MCRMPSELLHQKYRTRAKTRRIPGPPCGLVDRDSQPRSLLRCFAYLFDGITLACADVVGHEAWLAHPLQSQKMRFRNIQHVNVVSQATAIRGCIIRSIQLKKGPAA